MKKFLMLLGAMTLVFAMVGSASALSYYSDAVSLDVIIGEGPLAAFALGDTISYTHATPDGFEVPWDTDVSATLTILGYFIDGGDGGEDSVAVSGSAVGTLTPGGSYGWSWSWLGGWSFTDSPSTSTFDISTVFSAWSGSSLGVDIIAGGDWGDGILGLSTSTLDLSWTDGTAPGTAPVPEPATILLMGTGLLGLVGYSRKRFSKKS